MKGLGGRKEVQKRRQEIGGKRKKRTGGQRQQADSRMKEVTERKGGDSKGEGVESRSEKEAISREK